MATDSVTVSPTFNGDSVSLTAGMIVRLKPGANNNVVRAQADSAPHVQGVNGVVVSGSSAPGTVCTVACVGRQPVQMESSLVPAVGDTVYVSPTVPGKGTNVQPGSVATIGSIADISNYVRLGTVIVDIAVGEQGTAGATGPQGFQGATGVQGFQGTAGSQGAQGSGFQGAQGSQGTQGSQGATGPSSVASWGTVGSVRYFACDGTSGSDANAGFSDVSQAAAGLVAVQTIAKLMSLIPKFGSGRKFRAAIRSGNYASDTAPDFSGFSGYQTTLIIATDTVVSAGATAFAGDTNDTICAGMTTATGMNAAGYNPTAYSVAGDGTPTITLQLAGGGTPSFPAAPARPYGARLRFDVATTTAALRNFGDSVLLVPTVSGAQLILGVALPANPVSSDVCYLEMPNVTGPTTTIILNSQGIESLQLCGLSLGGVVGTGGGVKLVGCESGFTGVDNTVFTAIRTVSNLPSGAPVVGIGLRAGGLQIVGGIISLTDWVDTTTTQIQEPVIIQAERFSAGGMIVFGGAHMVGNNIVETIGSNSSTNHGATCQIWQPHTAVAGVLACGLAVQGSYQIGRIKCSNMGANPGVRINGAGLGVALQNISGGIADGNTDVGVDLSPSGVSGNTLGATGSVIAIVPTNTMTGSNGDVRLSDGTIVTWAVASAGVMDANGNRLFAAGNAPLGTATASAATAVALGNVAPGTVTSSTPTAWTTLVIDGVKYMMPLWPST